MILKRKLTLAICALLLIGCSTDRLDVDVTDVKVDIQFIDLDSTFYHSDSLQLINAHHEFKESIKDVYEFQLGQSLQFGNIPDSELVETNRTFLSDPYVSKLEAEINDRFKDKSEIRASIVEGFKHLRYHIPDAQLPNSVVFLNSMFLASAPCFENEVAVGLDYYLGDTTPVIQELAGPGIHEWIKKRMRREFLERDAVTSWVLANVIGAEPSGSVIEKIIYYGKALYIVEACFPEIDKNIVVRYTKEQQEWAEENSYSFWKYLVDEQLMFSIDERIQMNLLNDGPFTPGLPEKGPDRLGQFLGWKIVHQYMENNRKVSVADMIKLPYNTILQQFEIEE